MSLQLENVANWTRIFETDLIAATIPRAGGREQYVPIPPFTFPLILDNPRLAIRTESADAGARWYLGARVDVLFRTNTVGPSLPLSELIYSRVDARVNRTSYLDLPTPTAQYQLRFDIPYWFKAIKIIVWEYTGPV